jgi:hypothetical protein
LGFWGISYWLVDIIVAVGNYKVVVLLALVKKASNNQLRERGGGY